MLLLWRKKYFFVYYRNFDVSKRYNIIKQRLSAAATTSASLTNSVEALLVFLSCLLKKKPKKNFIRIIATSSSSCAHFSSFILFSWIISPLFWKGHTHTNHLDFKQHGRARRPFFWAAMDSITMASNFSKRFNPSYAMKMSQMKRVMTDQVKA